MLLKQNIKSVRFLYKLFVGVRSLCKRFLITIKCILTNNRNERKQERLVILGTGPSLKEDITRVFEARKNCSVMAVNSFCLDDNFLKLKPEFYILADPCYYTDTESETGKSDRDIFIKKIKQALNWKMKLILPESGRNSFLVKELHENHFISFEFINSNCSYYPYFINRYKAYNKNIATVCFQNVLLMCLYYAIFKKYPIVYLFGADHNWCKDITVRDDNVVYIEENHCYEQEHHKSHRLEKVDGSLWTMGELFSAWTRVYNGYYEINEYALVNDVKIYNCSSVSFIDAFERKGNVF